jgi:hypothetical protein
MKHLKRALFRTILATGVGFSMLSCSAWPGAMAMLGMAGGGGGGGLSALMFMLQNAGGRSLVRVEVTLTDASIAKGTSTSAKATAIYSDNTKSDVTSKTTFVSDNTAIALPAGSSITGLTVGSATISAAFQGKSGSVPITVTAAVLSSISVTPSIPSIANGTTQQFTATGIFTDSTTQDLTASVTWNSSNTAKATIDVAGLATGTDVGSTTITATSGVKSGSTTLTVTAAVLSQIQVTPANPSIANGTMQQFTATGIYSDSTTQDLTATVTWSSSDTGVATIDASGLATGIGLGPTTINATSGISGNATLNVTAAALVSISVTPTNPSKAKGLTQQFIATGTYSDGSTLDITNGVIWSSDDTNIATISNTAGSEGLATAVDVGSATIRADGAGGVFGTTTFNVTAAILVSISVTPTNPSVAKGLTRQFTATGTYTDSTTQNLTDQVTWSSSNTARATISNAAGSEGLATAVSVGSATVTATDPISGTISGSTTMTVTSATLVSIAVTPTNPGMTVNRTLQFISTGTYSDSSTQDLTSNASCSWSSSNTAKALISNAAGSEGIAGSLATGSTTITHTCGAINGSTTLTVTAATLSSITVTPVNPSLAIGFNLQFTATGIFSDSSTQDLTEDGTCSWSSSVPGNATVSSAAGSRGLATPVSTGSTTIMHTCGAVSGSTTLTVTNPTLMGVSVTPASPSIANGTGSQFTATGTFSDSTTQDITTQVTWSSSATGVATISNAAGSEGYASGVGAGSSTITATHAGTGKTDTTTLAVTNATLSSIAVTPNGAVAIGYGTTQQFTAIGTYSNGATQNITDLVTWSSSAPGFATISNVAGSNGLATSVSAGTTNVSATLGAVTSNTASLEVRIITLQSIAVTPANPTVTASGTQQFYATGTFNDGTQQDLTTQVTWTSADTAVAIVSNVGGSQGVATAVGTNGQTATITATRSGISGGTLLTVASDVTAPTLLSAALQPGNRVRIVYSEPISVSQATTIANYRITTTVAGLCSDNSNFTGSSTAVNVSSVDVVSTSEYILNLASGTASATYTVLVDKTGVSDLVGNALGCANSANFVGEDTVSPTLNSATSLNGTTIRVTFSESVNSNEATTASNYKVVNAPASGTCSAGSNFSSSAQTADFSILSVVSVSGSVYDINLSATQVAGKSYTVLVNKANIHDIATTPNVMACPNNADFTGLEQLKISSTACVDTTHVIATFSKQIKTGLNAAGSAECTTPAECASRYKFNGGTSLGTINEARTLDGTICDGATVDATKVCITHSTAQGGGQYTLTVANNVDGDGFDNTTWGSIRDSGNTENVQPSPNDRRTFNGCSSTPQNFDDGPIATDPFADGGGSMGGTDFSYIFEYGGLVYMGPNVGGSGGIRMNPDGSNPQTFTFALNQDPNQDDGAAAINTVYGNPPTQLFPSLGKTGCTANTAACGPNNQNGRGVFTSGTIGGTTYLFAGAGYTLGNLTSIYYSTDTDTALDFPFLHIGNSIVGGPGAKGFSSLYVYNNALYLSFPSNGTNRPKMGQITGLGTLGGTLPARRGSTATGVGMELPGLPRLGGTTQCTGWTDKITSVETFMEFNGYLYLSGGGCPASGKDGGIIRYTNGTFSNNGSYVDSTPSSASWAGTNRYSIYLNKMADLTPDDKAFPQMAVHQGKLYAARNICEGFTGNSGAAGGAVCPTANRHTQLWKCSPASSGGATTCEAADWTLVADNGSGNTTMGDANNVTISMVVTNGSYLYVGYNNANGVQIWRTNSADPAIEGDFSQISTNGLGDTANNIEIFDAKPFNFGGTNYIYLTTGKTGGLVKVYRQQNN